MDTVELTIHNMGINGEGVGSLDGYTLFVEGALPGEIVRVSITERNKNYGRADLISIVRASPDRVAPPCPLFGKCGGCQLMHLSYAKQLETKRQRVADALQRIGKITGVTVEPCVPSPLELAYRNKIQLPVRKEEHGMALGLYARNSHALVEVDHCHIHCELGEEVFKEVRAIVKRSKIVPYDAATGKGELRHLLIKSAVNSNEALVVLVTTSACTEHLSQIAKEIMQKVPAVKGVVHNINKGKGNVILGRIYDTLEGVGMITESICGMTFKVSAASFFQVNPLQAEKMYSKALEYASLTGQEQVLDAYCGVGTLSLFFAKHAKKVIGVECVAEAILDAEENAKCNEIKNATFVCADAERYIKTVSSIDVVLLNPPRKGCDEAFLEGVGILRPKSVIYISCDPATLARDLLQLSKFGYRVEAVQPYDMFPQTAHVETVVKLSQ